VPFACVALSVDVLRRANVRPVYFAGVAAASLLAALALHAWVNVAFFEPLFALVKAVS